MPIADDVLTSLPAEPLASAASKVRSGDILLCAAHDPFSRLIAWSTGSPWTHVALAWRWPSLDRILVTECVQHLGVRAVALDKFVSETSSGTRPYPGKIILARHADVDPAKADGRDPAADFAIDRLGDRFSPAGIGKIALRIVVGRLERAMPPMLEAKDEFICSEYVARALQRVGAEIDWDRLGFLAPVDIARDRRVGAITQIQTQ